MLKLSRLADYGVVLMSQMATSLEAVHNAQTVADSAHLPLPTVSKLLSALARAGLLVASRGVKGGFKLARHPEKITVGDIISAVDGPVALTHCIERGPGACGVEVICPTRRGWQMINDAVRNALAGVTLADLTAAAPMPRSLRVDGVTSAAPSRATAAHG